jgi:hypothetical protein
MSADEAAQIKALSGVMQKERAAAEMQTKSTAAYHQFFVEKPGEMLKVSGKLLARPKGVEPEAEEFVAAKDKNKSIIADLEKKIDELKNKIQEVKRHAKAIYDTAHTLYKGVITPMASVSATINSVAPDCAANMQPALVGGGLYFAMTTSFFSKIDEYDQGNVDKVIDSLNSLKNREGSLDKQNIEKLQNDVGDLQRQSVDLNESLRQEQDDANKILRYADGSIKTYSECINGPKPKTPEKIYDPLSIISHQINFIVTYGGSVNPTWKLARVSAPNSPLFAATRKYTNTLIIAMGREAKDVSTQIQTQLLRAAFQNP